MQILDIIYSVQLSLIESAVLECRCLAGYASKAIFNDNTKKVVFFFNIDFYVLQRHRERLYMERFDKNINNTFIA